MAAKRRRGPRAGATRSTALARPGADEPARVIAMASGKGGVGKSTTTINVGAAMAQAGRRVLLVDGDPSCEATARLSPDLKGLWPGLAHVLLPDPDRGPVTVRQTIRALRYGHPKDCAPGGCLHVSPGPPDLERWNDLQGVPAEAQLREALAPVRRHYDYILTDTQAALTRCTRTCLVACDEVLIIQPPSMVDYGPGCVGLLQLLRRLRGDHGAWGYAPVVLGLAVVRDLGGEDAEEDLAELRASTDLRIFDAIVPESKMARKEWTRHAPVVTFAPKYRVSKQYAKLADEIMRTAPQRFELVAR
jgi:chromosome partitioning protein